MNSPARGEMDRLQPLTLRQQRIPVMPFVRRELPQAHEHELVYAAESSRCGDRFDCRGIERYRLEARDDAFAEPRRRHRRIVVVAGERRREQRARRVAFAALLCGPCGPIQPWPVGLLLRRHGCDCSADLVPLAAPHRGTCPPFAADAVERGARHAREVVERLGPAIPGQPFCQRQRKLVRAHARAYSIEHGGIPRERCIGRVARQPRPGIEHDGGRNASARIANDRVEHARGVLDEIGSLEQWRRRCARQSRGDGARERRLTVVEQQPYPLCDELVRQLALRTQPLKRRLALGRQTVTRQPTRPNCGAESCGLPPRDARVEQLALEHRRSHRGIVVLEERLPRGAAREAAEPCAAQRPGDGRISGGG